MLQCLGVPTLYHKMSWCVQSSVFYALANNATVPWDAHNLPQWELVCISDNMFLLQHSMHQNMYNSTLFVLYTFTYVFDVFDCYHVCLIACIELHCWQWTEAYTRSEANNHVTSLIAHAQ